MNIHLDTTYFVHQIPGFSPIAIFDKWVTLFWEGRPSHLSICTGIFSSDAAVSQSWRCLWNQLGNPQKETSRILANSRHKESSETTKDRESLPLIEDFRLGATKSQVQDSDTGLSHCKEIIPPKITKWEQLWFHRDVQFWETPKMLCWWLLANVETPSFSMLIFSKQS